MPNSLDPVITAALEYETATLLALQALKGTDRDSQREACLRLLTRVETGHMCNRSFGGGRNSSTPAFPAYRGGVGALDGIGARARLE
jgi:hypothetical protein